MNNQLAAQLQSNIAARADQMLDALIRLIRIPSVSSPGHDPRLLECATMVAELANEAGLSHVELLRVPDAAPYVYGEWLGAPGRPTLLLYGHYDVQPAGDVTGWANDPFEAVISGERLFGRGAADDKAGVLLHLAAIRAWLDYDGTLPVNVRLLIEGEEESGSVHCEDFISGETARLACDGIILADSANWAVGAPTLTHSLRGSVALTVEVRSMRSATHSGVWGGLVPDPLMALCRTLSALVDVRGVIAIPGFFEGVWFPTTRPANCPELDEAQVRARLDLAPGSTIWGDAQRTYTDRLWYLPTVTIRALDAPPVQDSANAIQAVARALLNVRLGPRQDADRAAALLEEFIRAHVPWGLAVSVRRGAAYSGWYADPSGPLYQAAQRAMERAFGAPVLFVGIGASLPLVGWLLRGLGEIPVLLTGVEDPLSAAHGPDESLHIGDWRRAILAEALLFEEAAGWWWT